MKTILIILSLLALIAIVTGTILFMHGNIAESMNKQIMLWCSITWFVITPFWLRSKKS